MSRNLVKAAMDYASSRQQRFELEITLFNRTVVIGQLNPSWWQDSYLTVWCADPNNPDRKIADREPIFINFDHIVGACVQWKL